MAGEDAATPGLLVARLASLDRGTRWRARAGARDRRGPAQADRGRARELRAGQRLISRLTALLVSQRPSARWSADASVLVAIAEGGMYQRPEWDY